jgi:hypothetical protein
MAFGVSMISRRQAAALQRATPKAIRAEILGVLTPNPLIIADRAWVSSVLDAEVGMHLMLPANAQAANDAIVPVRELPDGRLFEAARPGIARVTQLGSPWAVFARIARREYVGRADFRHLEDDPDE